MLLENLSTRRVSEENASKSSLTRRVTKQGHLPLAALAIRFAFLSNSTVPNPIRDPSQLVWLVKKISRLNGVITPANLFPPNRHLWRRFGGNRLVLNRNFLAN